MLLRLQAVTGLLLAALCLTPLAAAEPTPSGKVAVYFGTYTGSGSQGIYLGHLDLKSGKLELDGLAAETTNPSFLAIHATLPMLYAVGEWGKDGGKVSAFSIDAQSGKLTLVNQQPSQGGGPCHVTVDRSGRCVLVANYGSGSVACLPLDKQGKLGPSTSFYQHEGSGADPRRQKGPHAHSMNVDPANRFAFAADLGLDKILIYRLDAEQAKLTPNEPAFAVVERGSGPRHFAFHPGGKYAYVINEMTCTVTAFRYDAKRGALEPIQTIRTLPADFEGSNTTAEVQVHPSGKFLYGSNRGHNSIAAFAVDPETGKLRSLGQTPSGGKTPRNFGIDPTGAFLLAAHQDSDNVTVFRIDQQTGQLQPTGQSVTVFKPVCVKFLQR